MNDLHKFFFLHKSGKIPTIWEFARTLERSSDKDLGKFLTRHFQ